MCGWEDLSGAYRVKFISTINDSRPSQAVTHPVRVNHDVSYNGALSTTTIALPRLSERSVLCAMQD